MIPATTARKPRKPTTAAMLVMSEKLSRFADSPPAGALAPLVGAGGT
jgi:hypothetical protein